MSDDYKKTCPRCSKKLPLFLTKFCGPCTYRMATETKKATEKRMREREAAKDTSGTHGDPKAEQHALVVFDAFARKVREEAGLPRR